MQKLLARWFSLKNENISSITYLLAYLLSANRFIVIDSDSDEERKVPAFYPPAIIEFTSSSDTDKDTEIFCLFIAKTKESVQGFMDG